MLTLVLVAVVIILGAAVAVLWLRVSAIQQYVTAMTELRDVASSPPMAVDARLRTLGDA